MAELKEALKKAKQYLKDNAAGKYNYNRMGGEENALTKKLRKLYGMGPNKFDEAAKKKKKKKKKKSTKGY
jgi:hypothetical protein